MLQSTEQRGFWGERKSCTLKCNDMDSTQWSQGVPMMEECLLRLSWAQGRTVLQFTPLPQVSPCNTIAAVLCIFGNCNVTLNLWLYEWLHICFLRPEWQGGTCTQQGHETTAVLDNLTQNGSCIPRHSYKNCPKKIVER